MLYGVWGRGCLGCEVPGRAGVVGGVTAVLEVGEPSLSSSRETREAFSPPAPAPTNGL